MRDLQEQEINDSYERFGLVDRCSSANDSERVDSCCQSSSDVPSIDQGPNQEMPNIQAAEGCCEVEKSNHKKGRLAVENDEYRGEKRKRCCVLNGLNRKSCCEATRDDPPSNDDDLQGDDCCEDDTTQRKSCCDLGFLKQHENEEGACCDGK